MKDKIAHIRQTLFQNAPKVLQCYDPVRFAYLYGSIATGLTHPFSDLDIAVYVHGLASNQWLDLEMSISLDIDKMLNHAIESDVRVLNHLPLIMKGEIITEGQLIYCIDEETKVDFEVATRMAYFDFLPIIREHYSQRLDQASGENTAQK